MTGMPIHLTHTPAPEVAVDATVVQGLLERQHPDLAGLPLRPVDSGWDNAMVRLGDDLAVRLPRRRVADPLMVNEQRWLGELAPRLPLPIPAPRRIGVPDAGFPFHWSVVPWLPGQPADLAEPAADQAEALAAFYAALHRPGPADGPHNPVRGIPLAIRAANVEERMARLPERFQGLLATLRPTWEAALAAAPARSARWLHGDSHARNLLVQDGRFSAVVDWGDVTVGDRATDLAVCWAVLAERQAREAFMAATDADAGTWHRAMGWAVLFGVVLLETGLNDNPRHALMGERTLRRLAAGPNAADLA